MITIEQLIAILGALGTAIASVIAILQNKEKVKHGIDKIHAETKVDNLAIENTKLINKIEELTEENLKLREEIKAAKELVENHLKEKLKQKENKENKVKD